MQIRQIVGIHWFWLSNHCSNNWSVYGLIYGLCSLRLQKSANRCITMNSTKMRVISQYFISQVLSNFFINIGKALFGCSSVTIPLLFLFFLL